MDTKLGDILKNPWVTHLSAASVALGGGIGIGYALWGRKPKTEVFADPGPINFDDIVARANEANNRRIIDEEAYSSGIVAPETDAVVMDDTIVVESPDQELVEVNVFESVDQDWDWEEELDKRDETKPFVIHREEFYENLPNYYQIGLTYYTVDDILADPDDKQIPNHETVIGQPKFGHGSGDEDTVFVRNHSLRADYEIEKRNARYEEEILGIMFEEETSKSDLKHSRSPGRFRMD